MKDAISWFILGAILGWALSDPAHAAVVQVKPETATKLPELAKTRCVMATVRSMYDVYPDGTMVRKSSVTLFEAC